MVSNKEIANYKEQLGIEYSSKIQIKLDNGMILIGLFYISTAKSVGEVLNYFIHLYSPKMFLDVEN